MKRSIIAHMKNLTKFACSLRAKEVCIGTIWYFEPSRGKRVAAYEPFSIPVKLEAQLFFQIF